MNIVCIVTSPGSTRHVLNKDQTDKDSDVLTVTAEVN